MITPGSFAAHLTRQGVPGAAAYPYDGSDTGMAADTLHRSALTVQQYVPNIGVAQTQPLTKVNPTHEQGWGRAPGWENGWMRKNIPFDLSFGSHGQPHLGTPDGGQPRLEGILASGVHAPGLGKWQQQHSQKPRRGWIPQPETAYLTAAVPPAVDNAGTQTWGEPV